MISEKISRRYIQSTYFGNNFKFLYFYEIFEEIHSKKRGISAPHYRFKNYSTNISTF